MKGKMPRYLSLEEHLALGVQYRLVSRFTHHVIWAALWDFMQEFQATASARGTTSSRAARIAPYPTPGRRPKARAKIKQRELEERYFSAAAFEKYRKSTEGPAV